MAIADGVGCRTLVSVGISATQSRHPRNGSRTGEEWTPWFSEPAKNEPKGPQALRIIAKIIAISG